MIISEKSIFTSILEFLKHHEMYESLRCLEIETGLSVDESLTEDIEFIRHVILEGDWQGAEAFFAVFADDACAVALKQAVDEALLVLRRQKFLELLDRTPGASTKVLKNALDSLRELDTCSAEVVNELKFCLSHMDPRVHFPKWTVQGGRYKCFLYILYHTDIGRLLSGPDNIRPTPVTPTLVKIFECAAIYEADKRGESAGVFPGPLMSSPLEARYVEPQLRPSRASPQVYFKAFRPSLSPKKRRRAHVVDAFEENARREREVLSQTMPVAFDIPNFSVDTHQTRPLRETPFSVGGMTLAKMKAKKLARKFRANDEENAAGLSNRRETFRDAGRSISTNTERLTKEDKTTSRWQNAIAAVRMANHMHNHKLHSHEQPEIPPATTTSNVKNPPNAKPQHKQSDAEAQDTRRGIDTEEAMFANVTGDEAFAPDASDAADGDLSSIKPTKAIESPTYEESPREKTALNNIDIPTSYEDLRHPDKRAWVLNLHPCCSIYESALPVRAASFTPNGEHCFVGSNTRAIQLTELSKLHMEEQSSLYVKMAPALSPQELKAVPLTFRQKLYLHLGYPNSIAPDLPIATPKCKESNVHNGSVYCAAWKENTLAEDFSILATGSNDKTIKIWRTALHLNDIESSKGKSPGFKELQTLTGVGGTIRDVHFLREDNNRLISTGGKRGDIVLWSLETGKPKQLLHGHKGNVFGLAESRTHRYIASCGQDRLLKVWDVRQRSCAATMKSSAPLHTVHCASKDSFLLATGSGDGVCELWDSRKGKQLFSARIHEDDIRSVRFSPDSEWLLTASFDGRCAILDLNKFTQNVVATFAGHSDRVLQAEWHPNNPMILTSSADGTAKLWSMLGKKFNAEESLGRNM